MKSKFCQNLQFAFPISIFHFHFSGLLRKSIKKPILDRMLIRVKESGSTGFSSGWQGCSLEQPCQPEENPVLPSSFTRINPICSQGTGGQNTPSCISIRPPPPPALGSRAPPAPSAPLPYRSGEARRPGVAPRETAPEAWTSSSVHYQ